jgi:hypothetical protein
MKLFKACKRSLCVIPIRRFLVAVALVVSGMPLALHSNNAALAAPMCSGQQPRGQGGTIGDANGGTSGNTIAHIQGYINVCSRTYVQGDTKNDNYNAYTQGCDSGSAYRCSPNCFYPAPLGDCWSAGDFYVQGSSYAAGWDNNNYNSTPGFF